MTPTDAHRCPRCRESLPPERFSPSVQAGLLIGRRAGASCTLCKSQHNGTQALIRRHPELREIFAAVLAHDKACELGLRQMPPAARKRRAARVAAHASRVARDGEQGDGRNWNTSKEATCPTNS